MILGESSVRGLQLHRLLRPKSSTFSVLRQSTECDRCHRIACSQCCRPVPTDAARRLCVSCIRQMKKSDLLDDDRPKWLREAQDVGAGSSNNSSFRPPIKHTAGHSGHHATIKKSGSSAVDERPKWLREAQEQSNPTQSPRSLNETHGRPLETNTSKVSDDIEQRLARLKAEQALDKPIQTEDALHERLARLSDRKLQPNQADHSILRPPVHLSETEEIENLISQMKDRVNLEDDDENLIEELESRLKRLKAETALLGISSSGTASPRLPSPQSQDQPNKRVPKPRKKRELLFSSMEVDDDDSDEEAEKVARSLTELMPEKDTVPGEDDSEKFCIICPDEPVLQCLDCDGDLYCGRCFRESHKEWDLKGHRTKKVC